MFQSFLKSFSFGIYDLCEYGVLDFRIIVNLKMTNVELLKHINASFNLTFGKCLDIFFYYCGEIILIFLQYVYTLFIHVRELCCERYNQILCSFFKPVENIKNKVTSFEKVPVHIAFIFGTEPASYRDIVKIVQWCLPAEIRNISFYSYNNDIEPYLIFQALCKYGKDCIHKVKWGKSFSKAIKGQSEKHINGYVWKPQITVHVYKREDGLHNVLEVAKELHNEGIRKVKTGELNAHLLAKISAPDPDLVIVCGDTLSPYGFLPWHLRISQFLLLHSHHNIRISKFLDLLEKYSKCQQRFGQ